MESQLMNWEDRYNTYSSKKQDSNIYLPITSSIVVQINLWFEEYYTLFNNFSNLDVISIKIELSIFISFCTVYIPPNPSNI